MAKRKTGWGGRRKGAGRKHELNDSVLRSVAFERVELERLAGLARSEKVSTSEIVRRACWVYLRMAQPGPGGEKRRGKR
jgi:hypothetical protein